MLSYFKKKRIQSKLKKNEREHVFHNFSSIKRIVVLFNYKDHETIVQIAKDLKSEGKSIMLWAVEPKEKKTVIDKPYLYSINIITPKQVSGFGKVDQIVLDQLNAKPYDTILDLTTVEEYPLLYLLSGNSAEFSIGISNKNEGLYDFILLKDEEMSIMEAYDQIKFYLNNISKGTNNS